MKRGLCRELFGDRQFGSLSPEELRIYHNAWTAKNRPRLKVKAVANRIVANKARRERLANDPELRRKIRAREKVWRLTHSSALKICYRKYRLKAGYGLSLGDFDRMVMQQGGLCAMCGRRPKNHSKILVVDHDHKSGHVRGLLCFNCNMVLGHLRDDVSLMRRVIKYLQACEAAAMIRSDKQSPKGSAPSGPLFLDTPRVSMR